MAAGMLLFACDDENDLDLDEETPIDLACILTDIEYISQGNSDNQEVVKIETSENRVSKLIMEYKGDTYSYRDELMFSYNNGVLSGFDIKFYEDGVEDEDNDNFSISIEVNGGKLTAMNYFEYWYSESRETYMTYKARFTYTFDGDKYVASTYLEAEVEGENVDIPNSELREYGTTNLTYENDNLTSAITTYDWEEDVAARFFNSRHQIKLSSRKGTKQAKTSLIQDATRTSIFEYDDKINPFTMFDKNVSALLASLDWFSIIEEGTFLSKNNVVSATRTWEEPDYSDNRTRTFNITYNDDDFPTKYSANTIYNGDASNVSTTDMNLNYNCE